MKVMIIEFAGKGGMIHYTFQLARAMAQSGLDVTLVTGKHYELEGIEHPFRMVRAIELWDPKPDGSLSASRVAVAWRRLRRAGRAVRYYREWLRVIRLARALKPDVVQLGDIRFPSDILPLMLMRRSVPLLADICHNVHPFSAGGASGGLFDRSRWRRFVYRRIYGLFDLVFVHFARNREEFISSFRIDPGKVEAIVHGNELLFNEIRAPELSAASLRRRLGIGPDEPVVLFFGTLSKYKGTDVLMDAFPKVAAAAPARLVLAGFPFHDFEPAVHRRRAEELGLADSVIWVTEYVPSAEVAAWMEMASVIVFPYRDIYQSGALHIAQTFGVPTIVSAVGALPDVIRDGESGLVVPAEDPAALARAITRLLLDRRFAAQLGARAAKDARDRFSWEEIAATIAGRYRALS